jgi:hypothetical protein
MNNIADTAQYKLTKIASYSIKYSLLLLFIMFSIPTAATAKLPGEIANSELHYPGIDLSLLRKNMITGSVDNRYDDRTYTATQLSATVELANMYLYRGNDLSKGNSLVAGSLDYQHLSGIYASVWSASGDKELGLEYDVVLGFASKIANIEYDLGYISYIYPNNTEKNSLADNAEYYLSVEYSMLEFSLWKNTDITKNGDYAYYTFSANYNAFSVLLGMYDDGLVSSQGDYSHLDLAYDFNAQLRFTLSQAQYKDESKDKNFPYFMLSYSLSVQ